MLGVEGSLWLSFPYESTCVLTDNGDVLLGCLFGSYVGYNVVVDDSCKTPVN